MINKEKGIDVNIGFIFIIAALFCIPLACAQSLSLPGISGVLLFVTTSLLIGAFILFKAGINGLLSGITCAVLSVFLGSLILSLLIFLHIGVLLTTALLLALLIALLAIGRKKIPFTFSFAVSGFELLVLLVTVIVFTVISLSFDFYYQFSNDLPQQNVLWSDNYFFIALVSSLRKGTIFDAVYESHSPTSYAQLLGFFFPAYIANLLHITSRVAYWSVAQPFYKFVSILLLYDLSYFFLKDKVKRSNWLFVVLALTLPTFMTPLHPISLLKGHFKSAMLICMGYIFPNGMIIIPGTITFPFAFALFIFSALLFANIKWESKPFSFDKLLFGIIIGLLATVKVPVFLCALSFYGIIVLMRFTRRHKIVPYLPAVFLSVAIAFLLIRLFNCNTLVYKNTFRYGYLADMFATGYHIRRLTFKNDVVVAFLILFSYIAWLSIRNFGLWGLFASGSKLLREYLTGSIFALLAITVLCSFWQMTFLDSKGNPVSEGTFNVQQYIQTSFYFLSIFSSVGMLVLFYQSRLKIIWKYALGTLLFLWCFFSSVSLSYIIQSNRRYSTVRNPAEYNWYYENEGQLKSGRYNDGLVAVNPNIAYYGIMLASCDYGKFWVAMGDDVVLGNYNLYTGNDYRWQLYRDFLRQPDSACLLKMKQEGVKYIVATPIDSAAIGGIARQLPDFITKVPGNHYFYQVK